MSVGFTVVLSDELHDTRSLRAHSVLGRARPCRGNMIFKVMSCILVFGTVSSMAYAQTTNASSAVDSVAAAAAWAKADTGRMMTGYRDLSAYDTPGYCLAAMDGTERLTWRRGESDTLPKRTLLDTVPTKVRDMGRACIAKMTPRSVPPVELYNLTRVALRLGDTALARQTVEYHLSITTTNPRARGYVLVDAISGAAEARPIQFPFIESMLPKVSALGKGAVDAGVLAYTLAQAVAHDRFDTTRREQFSAARHALIKTLTTEEKKALRVDLGSVFSDSLEIVWYHVVPNLSSAVKRLGEQWAAANGTEKTQFAHAVIYMATTLGAIVGQPAPTVNVLKRYPADAPLVPVPGKVTIVMNVRSIGRGMLDGTMARLRRMHERYHDRGLDIVLVARTAGYAWASPPLVAEAEANLFEWYYREHLKLPFSVLVEETSFGKRPDGRRVAQKTPFQSKWDPIEPNGYIVGRTGIVKAVNYGFHSEAELEGYLLRELAEPVQGPQ